MVERYIAKSVRHLCCLKLSIRYILKVQQLTIDNKPCDCLCILFPSALVERNVVSEGTYISS